MTNYEKLKKEFLLMREEFTRSKKNEKDIFQFQEHIKQYLAQKTPKEAKMIADIMLECMNEDIKEAESLIREAR